MQRSVLIVGGGIAGLATAWALGRRGRGGVVLVEAEPTLGAQSTGKNAAILRTAVADPVARELGRTGAHLLRRPPADLSAQSYVDGRGLILTADDSAADALAGMVAALGPDVARERLTPDALRRIAPHWRGGATEAWLFPAEGVIDVARLVADLERSARDSGVWIRPGRRVEALLAEGGAVVGARLSDGAELRAETTVLAAGGWCEQLGRTAGSRVALTPTRRHLAVTELDPTLDARSPVVWSLGAEEFYARPESGGWLVCGCDEVACDPNASGTEPAAIEQAAVRAGRHLRGRGHLGFANVWSGIRTKAADGRFAVGHDPDVGGLFWVGGLGGHGITSGLAVGGLAADLLEGAAADEELAQALDPARCVPAAT